MTRGRLTLVGTLALLLAATAVPSARAEVEGNPAAITVPGTGADGRGTPYPSTIAVSGLRGPITDVDVSFTGVTHGYPSDLDTLLVGPGGQQVILMADTGGNTPIATLHFTFDDEASASLPVSAPITAGGTYRPTNGSTFNGTAPAPGGPYATTLSALDGANANGTWSLYAFDDFSTDRGGTIAGGWSIDVTTLHIDAVEPAAGAVADEVELTGSGFTGATAVTFGSVPAVGFTVDSDARITAAVPVGAVTGPIHVTVPAGTAASEEPFVVRHRRAVSLSLNGRKGAGSIDVLDGLTTCAAAVPVAVQHLKRHRWRTVAGDVTRADGTFKVSGLNERGKYRAVAKPTTLPTGDICAKAISPVVRR